MIVLMGIAGAGKSTQGQLLAKRLGCPHLSVGQLLRDQVKDRTLQQKMLRGELLDDELILRLLVIRLRQLQHQHKQFILDGCPRSQAQAEWLAAKIKAGELELTGIVHLKASQDTGRQRLLQRGRPDDNPSAIEQRFEEYEKTIVPIIGYLRSQGLPVYEVDGEGAPGDNAQRIVDALKLN